MTLGPVIEAHRGNSSECPENTLAAFRSAVHLGILNQELDVHRSRDGIWVVMHDAKVERTTGGSGAIAELSIQAIASLDAGSWKGASFRGEAVPTLAAVLDFARRHGARLNIEIKAFADDAAGTSLVGLLSRPEYSGVVEVISSFDLSALRWLRAAVPRFPLAMLGSKWSALHLAREHGFEWVHVHQARVSRDFVHAAHASGIRVMVWTVDRPEIVAHLARLGVDKICSNRPAVMCRARHAWQQARSRTGQGRGMKPGDGCCCL